jgi:GTPase Era involved in 16S rRNA processing
MTIKIAVAGHTNTGKTTFITTLMRMKVGKIDDSANVTTKGQFHYYDGLQAIFIDTPGFQNPSLALTFLKGTALDQEDMESIEYDLEAIEVIKQSDIAIYLGDLSVVPDDSHIKEIKIVKRIQPKVVAVLNQYHQNLQSGDKQKVENRITEWTKKFNQNGINDVIIFDAHWDKRSKEKKIYDAIEKNLDESKKSDFRE